MMLGGSLEVPPVPWSLPGFQISFFLLVCRLWKAHRAKESKLRAAHDLAQKKVKLRLMEDVSCDLFRFSSGDGSKKKGPKAKKEVLLWADHDARFLGHDVNGIATAFGADFQ